jgi:hypothetical protein
MPAIRRVVDLTRCSNKEREYIDQRRGQQKNSDAQSQLAPPPMARSPTGGVIICEGQVMVLDKLGAHRTDRVRELIEGRGADLLVLALLLA